MGPLAAFTCKHRGLQGPLLVLCLTHPWEFALSLHQFQRHLDPEAPAILMFIFEESPLKMLLLEIRANKLPVRNGN